MGLFKKWIEQYRETVAKRDYERGFQWAMSEYYLEGKSIDDILSYTEEARHFDKLTPFDNGVNFAVEILIISVGSDSEAS